MVRILTDLVLFPTNSSLPRIFDLVHFVLNANSMYEYSVTEFGNPAALGKITW